MLIADTAKVKPFIPANKNLPEITFRAVLLGISLAIILAASSTFAGLKITRTIAGSIPAALLSMLILRNLRNSNILENNMVQTIASAGESVAAGSIFTLPALIIIGYWKSFDYWQTAFIAIISSILGVLFSIPLRKSMIVEEKLIYPEAVAVAEILKAGEAISNKGTQILIKSSLLSAIISFMQTGLKIAEEQIQCWFKLGSTSAIGGSLNLSSVLTAAGFIVGIKGLLSFVAGGALTWLIAIPVYAATYGLPFADDLGSALALIHKDQFRYVGTGALIIGGIWNIIGVAGHIINSFKYCFSTMKNRDEANLFTQNKLIRTETDLPFKFVIGGILILSIPLFLLFFSLLNNASLVVSNWSFWAIVLFTTVFSLVFGLIAAAIAAYIVGIVGTTSLPVSGIGIAAIFVLSIMLLLILKSEANFFANNEACLAIAAVVIIFAAIICVTTGLSGGNMQVLKSGQLVGATPWKQQLMLIIGGIAAALVIPLILQTTFEAYGIADVLPRSGMDPKQALPAPQATLMAAIAKGFFVGQLPWGKIIFGAGLGMVAILFDMVFKKHKGNIRFPVLLFALGIYLPLGYVSSFMVGGIINFLVKYKINRNTPNSSLENTNGLLCASGIIAGESILGAILTIPFAYYKNTNVFALTYSGLLAYKTFIGVALYICICLYMYKKSTAH